MRSTSVRLSPLMTRNVFSPSRSRKLPTPPAVPRSSSSKRKVISTPNALPSPKCSTIASGWWCRFAHTLVMPCLREQPHDVLHDGPVEDRHHGLGRLVGERPQARAEAGGHDHGQRRVAGAALGARATRPLAGRLDRPAHDVPSSRLIDNCPPRRPRAAPRSKGSRSTPASVTIAVMLACGVTSKAG